LRWLGSSVPSAGTEVDFVLLLKIHFIPEEMSGEGYPPGRGEKIIAKINTSVTISKKTFHRLYCVN
jgi:hypothetical protein